MAAPLSWTGFYIGINGGYGTSTRSVGYLPGDGGMDFAFNAGLNIKPVDGRFESRGGTAGFQIGYNYQIRSFWLVGLEADYNWSDFKGSYFGPPQTAFVSLMAPAATERVSSFGTVRARLGVTPSETVLGYVTGGFAYGHVNHSARYVNVGAGQFGNVSTGGSTFACLLADPSCFSGETTDWRYGWTAGAGAEVRVFKNVTLKAEYLHVSLDKLAVREVATSPFPGSTAPLGVIIGDFGRTNFEVFRLGLNWQFNGS